VIKWDIAIIASALTGLNVTVVLRIGVGSIIGVAMGNFNVVGLFETLQTGMSWMQDLAIITIMVGGLVGLMKYYGGIDYILQK